jgi:hypothetical protein
MNKGCSIYKDRPKDPCQNFVCEWMKNENIPEWMKPDLVNVIIKKDKINHIEFYNVVECGKKIDSTVLNWVYTNLILCGYNVFYEIDGGKNYMGSTEFVALMDKS